ncbi:MAG TPA: flavodoxin domain-containing protein, partial [Methanomassiliicoccaceae archaeon]|jgi:menaquinone-dependent protoporphyrinogen IX oxidase|nr:flavodoxin domain-containing protein [Methanomassiliicoccaceae archaeon]
VDIMKGIVAFDSVYGNTRHVAEAMAEEIKAQGLEVALVNIGQTMKFDADADFILIGSPTRMKQMTFRTKRFIKKARKVYAGKPGAAFETKLRTPTDPTAREKMAKWIDNTAGPKIREMAEEGGIRMYDEVLRAEVVDTYGPLMPNTLEQSREFVRRFLANMNSI